MSKTSTANEIPERRITGQWLVDRIGGQTSVANEFWVFKFEFKMF